MKTIIPLTLLGLMLLSTCERGETLNPKPISNSINKIMTLGASRVEGARPEYESFRYELWKELVENDWTFDFIGTQSDEAAYPDVNGLAFDFDHEGRGGWTSGDILDGLDGWLAQTGSPDIVLFSSPGGNDGLEGLSFEEAVTNINEIIDRLQNQNPEVTIVIEQLAPARSDIMTAELTAFLEQMQQEVLDIASSQTTSSSSVITVDMFTGFSESFFADEVHYNDEGAEFVANRYYNVLIDVLEE